MLIASVYNNRNEGDKMALDTNSITQQAIINAAMEGFLTYGYHGFTMEACAEKVGIKKGSLYYHIDNKIDLAMRVLEALTKRSVTVICEEQHRFLIPDGASLAILPARLWESGEPELQQQIQAYYEDWQFNFLGVDGYFSTTNGSVNLGSEFYAWVGYWLMQLLGTTCESLFKMKAKSGSDASLDDK